MKKFSKFTIILLILFAISLGFNIFAAVAENTAEPGSEQDPLVSKAYVDEVTTKYMAEISKSNEQIAALKTQLEASNAQIEELKNQLQTGSTGASIYAIVNLEAGQQLLPGAGTEIILTNGKAAAVAGKEGLLLDATSAKTLSKGTTIVLNHMLISAKDDGRGIKASAKSTVIVKGVYKTTEKTPADNTTTPTVTKTVKGKVNATSLRVRAQPSTDAKQLTAISKGQLVEIIGAKNDWMNIKTATGVTGWVLAKYITKQ